MKVIKNLRYYQISKYSTNVRLSRDAFSFDWTSVADVGRSYNGKIFTMDDYCAMEAKYVASVDRILDRQGIQTLKLSYLERQEKDTWQEGKSLNRDEIHLFIKESLQEKCWGQLTGKQFIWEAGYDYYMHIGCSAELDEMQSLMSEFGLYVEPFEKISKLRTP